MYCIASEGSTTQVSCDTPDALIVISRVELAQMTPFYLDNQSAVAISGAMLMAMAVAFVLRCVRNYLEKESET